MPARTAKRSETKAERTRRETKPVIEIGLRSPMPVRGQVARIGRDYFQVVSFMPPLDLFRVTGTSFSYPEDIPICQRVRDGVKTGEPLPFPIFGEVTWGPAPRGMVRRGRK